MKIVEVKHPLVKHKLGLMREQDISTKRFRELASEVGSLLTYEATADLETEKVTIEGWSGNGRHPQRLLIHNGSTKNWRVFAARAGAMTTAKRG